MKRRLITAALLIFGLASAVYNASAPIRIIVADKITRGRTADEKVYEYVLPANEWVVTGFWITPSQEVMIHHLMTNDRVTVKLGLNDSRFQKAGTIFPLYMSRQCSTDREVHAKVTYTCVRLSNSEGVKLYAGTSVRVGIAVKKSLGG